MTPLNWFSVVFETVLIPTAACQNENWLGVGCFIIAILFVITYVCIYMYIFTKEPNRLQSEEYNLYQQEMLIEKGSLSLLSEPNTVEVQANSFVEKKE